jgi:hypothetical protein
MYKKSQSLPVPDGNLCAYHVERMSMPATRIEHIQAKRVAAAYKPPMERRRSHRQDYIPIKELGHDISEMVKAPFRFVGNVLRSKSSRAA